jgi:ubiquinone/menaquinone biosynthesis C-methylase UbiE
MAERTGLAPLAYALSQMARVGVFFGESLIVDRRTTPVKPPRPIEGPMPDKQGIVQGLRRLFERDWANIAAGHYRMPHDMLSAPFAALRAAPGYLREVPDFDARRRAGRAQEVAKQVRRGDYPRYYLQNFHFQEDGWFSRESARRYDHQVEVLFGGGADAMRRQALVPLRAVLERRGVRGAHLVDMACGTGRFLSFVKDNYPRLDVTALDLSPHYLDQARETLAPWRGVDFVHARAEATGVPASSADVITAVYLFHELPKKVRAQVAREAYRMLKPGGTFILVDSIQRGDVPAYDGLLEYFPAAFHEPYYWDYVTSDMTVPFGEAGFIPTGTEIAYFSRVMVFTKPEALPPSAVGGSK